MSTNPIKPADDIASEDENANSSKPVSQDEDKARAATERDKEQKKVLGDAGTTDTSTGDGASNDET